MRELVDAGLFGVEVDHRDTTRRLTRDAGRRSRAKYGLVATGSSDYHGLGKPNRLGENTTDPEVYAAILARGTGSKPFTG